MINTLETQPETEQRRDRGFTLVELLIVIVILGILSTVTVFAVRGITNQGQENACAATRKTYETAIEAFYAQNGNSVHPTGADLEAAGLVREYDTTYMTVTQGTGTGATATSTVAATAGGDCV
jgi:prepilin-type N-terminal cleavage/methylation domain-containing protein